MLTFNAGVTAEVENLTISGGNAGIGNGGGISNAGDMTVTESTVSGNAAAFGGGIDNTGTLVVSYSTLSANSVIGEPARRLPPTAAAAAAARGSAARSSTIRPARPS